MKHAWFVLLGLVTGCTMMGGPSGSPHTSSSPASSSSSSSSSGGGGGADEHDVGDGVEGWYTVSTMVDGHEMALTFVPPTGPDVKTVANNAGLSRVVLKKLTGSDDQKWHFHVEGLDHIILAKIGDPGQDDGGVLQVYGFSKEIGEDDKTNRVTVGNYDGATNESWHVSKLSDGKYRLENVLGTRGGSEQTWDKPRSLALAEGKLRNLPTNDAPAQAWTLKKVHKD